mgnify:FL=1
MSVIGSASQICKDNASDTITVGLMPEESLIITGSYSLHFISGEVEILGDFLVW